MAINAITRQVDLTADGSSRISRGNLNSSALTKNPNTGDGALSNIRKVINDYAEERENFNAEFDATMTSLRNSADRLQNNFRDGEGVLSMFGDFATFKIPPEKDNITKFQDTQRDINQPSNVQTQPAQDVALQPVENFRTFAAEYLVAENNDSRSATEIIQNLNDTRDENSNAALSNVRNFVETFNNAVDYFNENRSVSSRMNALAESFGDNRNLTQSLDAVGISVNESGRLQVNETKLAEAINENSSNVDAALGQNGLAGQLSRNVNLANSQRENLFTSVAEFAGSHSEPTESLYAAQVDKTAAHSKNNAGQLLNMTT